MNKVNNTPTNPSFENRLLELDKKISTAERKLSRGSAIPGVNITTGISKTLMGVVQLITALALTILLAPVAVFFKSNSTNPIKLLHSHAISHIAHGSGNVLSGLLESVIVVSTILYFVRDKKSQSNISKENTLASLLHPLTNDSQAIKEKKELLSQELLTQEKKFLKYSSIIKYVEQEVEALIAPTRTPVSTSSSMFLSNNHARPRSVSVDSGTDNNNGATDTLSKSESIIIEDPKKKVSH